MALRWHLLAEEKFINGMPGTLPTNDQRSRFAAFDSLDDVKKEWDIYPKLSKIGKSVFQEANCTGLRFLITANHKDNTGTKSEVDTFNDGGVYRTTDLANNATTLTLTPEQRKKVTNQTALELLDSGDYGRTSFHHIAVPIEVKYDHNLSAFTFPSLSKQTAARTVSQSDNADDADADATHNGDGARDVSAQDDGAAFSGAQNAEDEATVFQTTQVPKFIHCSVKGQTGLSQLGENMFKTFKYQHRIFSFAMYVCRNMCRLLRFDHSGAFVSTPFQWTSRDSALHTFLWKIAQMSNSDFFAGLGYDPTATLVEGQERETFAAMTLDHSLPQEVRTYVQQATVNNAPVYKVQVTTSPPTDDERLPEETTSKPTSKDGPHQLDTPVHETFEFVIGDPLFAADALVGRCTKGYVAYRLGDSEKIPNENRLCFLKDCWRPYVPGRTRPEHLVYQRLHSHAVKFIASLVCGGDVGGPRSQTTIVQEYLSDEPHLRPVPRVHYRLVTQEVGIPITEFKSFQELSKFFVHASMAHGMAWEVAHILHRDISVGNIMISPKNRTGFLIDWDLSRFEPELGNGPLEPDRSGTWQYRSALLLQFPRKPCRLSDDVESFVHAFRQLIVRFSDTSVTETLSDHVRTYYEQSFWRGGVMMGGARKLESFMSPHPPFQVQGDPSLDVFVKELADCCYSFYDKVPLVRMQKVYGIQQVYGIQKEVETNDDHSTEPVDLELNLEFEDPFEDQNAIATFRVKVDSAVEATQAPGAAETTDPCAIHGFLSSHSPLYTRLKGFATSRSFSPKGRDNFASFRSSVRVGQSSTLTSVRTGTITREHMAGNSGSPHVVDRRLESPRLPTPSSRESASSRPHSRIRKRARQDEVEDPSNSVAQRPLGEASASFPRPKSRRGRKQAKQGK
ncbi:hypothetical protein C8Q80DRAFT_178097 [Daedaleopsis nitida]|nr:hypothetical protein C8Q80DRAFT_178097 [Daedaleopsis nitida]